MYRMLSRMQVVNFALVRALIVVAAIGAAQATYCRAPPSLEHGGHSGGSYTGFRVGALVKYWCGSGYQLLGLQYNRCVLRSGSTYWESPAPLCIHHGLLPEEKDPNHQTGSCPELQAPSNGGVHISSTLPGAFAKYSCEPGFYLSGNTYRKCLGDGSWSGSMPTCKGTECPELADPENGMVKQTGGRGVGSQVWYVCDTGYVLVGSEVRTCQDDLQWDPEEPVCKPVVDCGHPEAPANGWVKLTGGTKPGATAWYSCAYGFTLVGSESRTCQENGEWEPKLPSCQPVAARCRLLYGPSFGFVTLTGTSVGSVATYSCVSTHRLEGNAQRVCQPGGSWSGEEPTCNVFDCGSLDDPQGGSVELSFSGTTLGSFAKYSCNDGYLRFGARYRKCLITGWTGVAPICKPVDCGPLFAPTNGAVEITGTTLGSNATYSCNDGYVLEGDSARICQSDRQWSGEPPTCKPTAPVCEVLPDPANGDLDIRGFTPGSTAVYNCDPGYLLVGDSTRTCQNNGQWSGKAPVCELVTCNDLANPDNGVVEQTGKVPSSTATYECNLGYILVGASSRTCQDDGTWSGEEPICEAILCPGLQNPLSGSVVLTGRTPDSTATYSCIQGYKLIGVEVRSCGQDGEWSGDEPKCVPVECGNLANPTNGGVSLTSTTLNSIATYSCNSGYILVGEETRECLADETWSGQAPICEPEAPNCDTLPDPENGLVDQTGLTVGSTASYSCFLGYELKGDSERTCTEGGWSGKEPTCEAVDCGPLGPPISGGVAISSTIFRSTAGYECFPGYLLVGVVFRECQADGFWDGQEPTCEPVECDTLDDPVNGRVLVTSIIFRSTARYLCDAGFSLFGVSNRECQEDGTWSDVAPTCRPTVDCGPLADPENGMVMLMGSTEGSKALYTCRFRFMLSGDMSRICQSDGQWSGEAPTCKPTECPSLAGPANGRVEVTGLSIGSTASYACDIGYLLFGENERTCQMDRTWSGEAPFCEPADCGLLGPPDNGEIFITLTTFASRAIYSCNIGFILQGNSERACLTTGFWSGTEPTCGLVPLCPVLNRPSNGDVSLSGRTPGSTADYSCNQGYFIVGDSQLVCDSNGDWSGQIPTCQPVDCGSLDPPENGGLSIVNTTLGSPAVYRCNAGFRLSGLERRVCTVSGQWSDTAPECILITCPPLTDPTNGQVTVTSRVFGSIATYDCDSGFILVGETSRTCLETGQWSGAEPQCEVPQAGCARLPALENGRRLGNNFTVGGVVFFRCFDDFDIVGSKYRVCQENGEWSGTQPVCQPFNDTCPGDKDEIFDRCGRRCQCVDSHLVNCCRVRKDYAGLDVSYRQAYINAFLTIARDDPIYQARYNDLVALYRSSFTQNNITQSTQPFESQFFTFNRYYLLEYEDLIKDIDCRLTIPYYDWTPFPETPYSAAVWNNDDGFGDTARSTDSCLITGPLEVGGFRITPSGGGGCLKREFRNQRFPGRDIVDRDLLPLPAEEFKDFHRFLQLFIGLNVQCFIGGTMCSSDAANDPVFILHLSQLDFLFSRWQGLRAGRQSVRYTGDTSPLLLSPGFTVEQFYTNDALPYRTCIQYDSPVLLKNHAPPPATLSALRDPAVFLTMDCAPSDEMDTFVPMTDEDHLFMEEQCSKRRVFRSIPNYLADFP